MDIVQEPLRAGVEDRDSGVFISRVIGTTVGITYVPR
jgi:hypothetical protein